MKTTTRELLQELTSEDKNTLKHLKKAYQALPAMKAILTMKKLLHWQKAVYNEALSLDQSMTTTSLTLGNLEKERFQIFFDKAPILSDVFKLQGNTITYNSALTDEEKIEIQEYIDEHHKILRRKRGFREWI